MKRFAAGVLAGWVFAALVGWAVLARVHAQDNNSSTSSSTSDQKIVQPQVVVDNAKVTVRRWILEPGQRSPTHTHVLDHVYVVVKGSKISEHVSTGQINVDDQETGRAAYSVGRGKTHYFENAGAGEYEMIEVELKQ